MNCVKDGEQNTRNLTKFWVPDPATKVEKLSFTNLQEATGPVYRALLQVGGINHTIWLGCNSWNSNYTVDDNVDGIFGAAFKSQTVAAMNDTMGPLWRNDQPFNFISLAPPFIYDDSNTTTDQQTASSPSNSTKRSVPPFSSFAERSLPSEGYFSSIQSSPMMRRFASNSIVPRDGNVTTNPNTQVINCGQPDASQPPGNTTTDAQPDPSSTAGDNTPANNNQRRNAQANAVESTSTAVSTPSTTVDNTQPTDSTQAANDIGAANNAAVGYDLNQVPSPTGQPNPGSTFIESSKVNWKVDITENQWALDSNVSVDVGSYSLYQGANNSSSITYIPTRNQPPYWVVEVASMTIGKDMVVNGPWKAMIGRSTLSIIQNLITDSKIITDTGVTYTIVPIDVLDKYTDAYPAMWPQQQCQDGSLPSISIPFIIPCNATDMPSITIHFTTASNDTYSIEMPGSQFIGNHAILQDATNSTDANSPDQKPSSEWCDTTLNMEDPVQNTDDNGQPINGSIIYDFRLGLPFMGIETMFFEPNELNGIQGDGTVPIKGRVGFAKKGGN